MKGLTQHFLEGLAEIIDTLNRSANPPSFNPTVAVLSALILTAAVSFSSGVRLPLLILAGSVILILLARPFIYSWVKIVVFIAFWATVTSAPLLFMASGNSIAGLTVNLVELNISREGFDVMAAFIVRVTAAAAVFTSFAFILGWRRIIKGLEGLGVPREITFFLTLSIIHIPFFLREASKMLSAREARIIRNTRFKRIWGILATVIGDLLLKSHERAYRIEKAINARSFVSPSSSNRDSTPKIKFLDLTLLSSTLCVPALMLLVGL